MKVRFDQILLWTKMRCLTFTTILTIRNGAALVLHVTDFGL